MPKRKTPRIPRDEGLTVIVKGREARNDLVNATDAFIPARDYEVGYIARRFNIDEAETEAALNTFLKLRATVGIGP